MNDSWHTQNFFINLVLYSINIVFSSVTEYFFLRLLISYWKGRQMSKNKIGMVLMPYKLHWKQEIGIQFYQKALIPTFFLTYSCQIIKMFASNLVRYWCVITYYRFENCVVEVEFLTLNSISFYALKLQKLRWELSILCIIHLGS